MGDEQGEPDDRFRRSSYCNGGDNCVEIARFDDDRVFARHSASPGDLLVFTRDEWLAFVAGVKDGEFDLS